MAISLLPPLPWHLVRLQVCTLCLPPPQMFRRGVCWTMPLTLPPFCLGRSVSCGYVQHATALRRYYGGGMIFGGGEVVRDGRWGCPVRHCPYKRHACFLMHIG